MEPGRRSRYLGSCVSVLWPLLRRCLLRCLVRDSSVGIATGYGPHGPGIESRWGQIFRTSPNRPWGPPSLLYNGYQVFPEGKERPVREADPSPPF